ncbi:MAG TPA: hypothetical protein ENJ12_10455 [Thiolapillus brandeum]|uniref:Uncharacterized protein n=1 Tax=Thiolapillus brandeum TaxID=1076588 RepID=A0A831WC70_9GAMM|nr:hypothetical protein [Thiolapillus brandeum]
MARKAGRYFFSSLLAITVTLAPVLAMAHGYHRPYYRVVVVKPAPPATVVVVKPGRRCRGYWHHGYWRCRPRPGRVLTHAVADAIWWESTH